MFFLQLKLRYILSQNARKESIRASSSINNMIKKGDKEG